MKAVKKENNTTAFEIEAERLIFFSDAVVAIAITLLAIELKVNKVSEHLTFSDLANSWEYFFSFLLSFIIIAIFWRTHYQFFSYIKKVNQRLIFYNFGWLFFIALLPFVTSIVGEDFFNSTAVFVYCMVVFFISLFQNLIWDNVILKKEFLKEDIPDHVQKEFKLTCNISMINALVAVILSFILPIFAFVVIAFRTITIRQSALQSIFKRGRKLTKGSR